MPRAKKEKEHLQVEDLPMNDHPITFYKAYFPTSEDDTMVLDISEDVYSMSPVEATKYLFENLSVDEACSIISVRLFCGNEPVENQKVQDRSKFILMSFALHDNSEFPAAVTSQGEPAENPTFTLSKKVIRNGMQISMAEYNVMDIHLDIKNDGKDFKILRFRAELDKEKSTSSDNFPEEIRF